MPVPDRLHARHAAAVLAPIVLASALLAYWAWQASVRHHAVAVALLRSHGQLAAQRYAARVGDELYVAATAIFQPVGGGRFDGGARGGPLVDPRAILDSVPALVRCRCAPVLAPAFAFRTDLTDAGTQLAGERAPSAEGRARLLAAVRSHLPQLRGGWDVAVVPGDAAPGQLVLITHRTTSPGAASPGTASRVLYGIAVDTATLRTWVFRPVLREGPLLAAPGVGVPNDSLLALRVVDRAGRAVFGTRVAPEAAHVAAVEMRPEWGWLAVEASVREPAALHGGRARVESGAGGGARFVVELPAAPDVISAGADVIPAKAGIQAFGSRLDPRLRGDDAKACGDDERLEATR